MIPVLEGTFKIRNDRGSSVASQRGVAVGVRWGVSIGRTASTIIGTFTQLVLLIKQCRDTVVGAPYSNPKKRRHQERPSVGS